MLTRLSRNMDSSRTDPLNALNPEIAIDLRKPSTHEPLMRALFDTVKLVSVCRQAVMTVRLVAQSPGFSRDTSKSPNFAITAGSPLPEPDNPV